MKESQSEEDNSSDSESFGNPDSPEESLDNGDKKEEDHNLKNAPAATKCNSDWDYSRCNICKNPNNPRQYALSPHATETYEDCPVPYMFVVSSHLYMPLISSKSWELWR